MPGAAHSYEIVNGYDDAGPFTAARVHCSRCPVEFQKPITKGTSNSNKLHKSFERLGWKLVWGNPNQSLCPNCNRRNHAAKVTERVAKLVANVTGHKVPVEIIDTETGVSSTMPAHPATTKTNGAASPSIAPTADQKAKIRVLLDGHFDDAAGCYLDGYNDQRIADEVGVPRAAVERIREAAYGPIKSNPEFEAIRAALGAARAEAERCFTEAKAAVDAVHALDKRVTALAEKMGLRL